MTDYDVFDKYKFDFFINYEILSIINCNKIEILKKKICMIYVRSDIFV